MSLDEEPMFGDDRQMEKLFAAKEDQGVHFVELQSSPGLAGSMRKKRDNKPQGTLLHNCSL